jgi:hypothetical protein
MTAPVAGPRRSLTGQDRRHNPVRGHETSSDVWLPRPGLVVAALASSTSVGRSSRGELERNVVPLLVETADRIAADIGRR